ncbi:hypothetical protein HZB00_00315, partial [Candidatus Woesearchaeota archaeon]|nr:hypothetical protein [Candidatus Woesearchaeota archaeon]
FMYSAISLVPFKKCSGEGWTTIQTCTCEGIEEQGVIVYDFKETRCIGIIADKECYHIDPRTGIKDKINCTN